MSVDVRGTLIIAIWIVSVGVTLVVSAPFVYAGWQKWNNIAADGVLTHKEYMQLSSREAKLLRACQRDAVWADYGPYGKLKAAQQREGQPTMPKFVDPGDPPSFQETMWKKGYKCQEDDWLLYTEE
jgi:hypothetical protein